MNASNDFFIRTTDDGHRAVVEDFVQRIYDAGEIYEGTYRGLYCVACEAFYAEAELVDGRCPQHGTVPEFFEEKNYFFRLSAYEDALLRLYDENPAFVLPRIGTTRLAASSSRGSKTSRSAARDSGGESRSRGISSR